MIDASRTPGSSWRLAPSRSSISSSTRGGHRDAADAAGEAALGEPDVAVGAAGDAGRLGAGEEVERDAARQLGDRASWPARSGRCGRARRLTVNQSAPSPPSAIPVGRWSGVRPAVYSSMWPCGLDACDRARVARLGEVEPAVGVLDDVARAAVGGEAVPVLLDLAGLGVDAADAAGVRAEREPEVAVAAFDDVGGLPARRQAGGVLGDHALGSDPADRAVAAAQREPEVAVGAERDARGLQVRREAGAVLRDGARRRGRAGRSRRCRRRS